MKHFSISDLPEHMRDQARKQLNPDYRPNVKVESKVEPCEDERELQKQANAYFSKLRDAGRIIDYFHLKNAKGERAGLPDILVFLSDNRILYFELKSKKGKLRPEQKRFIERAKNMNTEVHVLRDIESIIKVTKIIANKE